MIALIIRRIYQSIIVMLVVALVAFTLFRFVGDPVSQMVGQETSIADMERLREELGLNDPIIVQFGRFSWNTLQGKFGISAVDGVACKARGIAKIFLVMPAVPALTAGLPEPRDTNPLPNRQV